MRIYIYIFVHAIYYIYSVIIEKVTTYIHNHSIANIN